MESNRRGFLKRFLGGIVAAGTLTALPGPLKTVALRLGIPASAVVRVLGLSHSTHALRATWPAVAAVTARTMQARAWLIAGGATASAVLKAFVGRRTFLPTWYDPILRPSLRSIITGTVR